MGKALQLAGFRPRIDELVVSMNRAAEKATPLAKPICKNAVTNMSFDDANKILEGGDSAATDYFQSKTRDQLATTFKPNAGKAMSQVRVTTQYKELTEQYSMLPFVKVLEFDLDDYVVGKSLDGLFRTLAKEEQKIRTNPAARVTDLRQDVFGQKTAYFFGTFTQY